MCLGFAGIIDDGHLFLWRLRPTLKVLQQYGEAKTKQTRSTISPKASWMSLPMSPRMSPTRQLTPGDTR